MGLWTENRKDPGIDAFHGVLFILPLMVEVRRHRRLPGHRMGRLLLRPAIVLVVVVVAAPCLLRYFL